MKGETEAGYSDGEEKCGRYALDFSCFCGYWYITCSLRNDYMSVQHMVELRLQLKSPVVPMMSGCFNSCCRRVFALASGGRRRRLSRFTVKFTAALMLLVPSVPASGTLPSLPPVEEGKGPSFFLFRSMADSVMASARQGNARAQFLTGVCYYTGEGVGKDLKEAFQWFSRAAQQGDPESQFYLGVMHECGEGVEQDAKKAFEWYLLAAGQEYAPAQHNVGNFYYKGVGTEKDLKKAVKWLTLAAMRGIPQSQNLLGLCCTEGLGMEQDFKEASRSVSYTHLTLPTNSLV